MLLKRTQGSSLALIKTNRNAHQQPINQSVEHKKKVKNQWEACRYIRVNWSWSPNGVRIGRPYHGLWLGYWSFMSFIHLRQRGAMCPTHCPGKPKSTYSPNEKVKSKQTEQHFREVLFWKSDNIDVENRMQIHISTKHTACTHNWLHRFQHKEIF